MELGFITISTKLKLKLFLLLLSVAPNMIWAQLKYGSYFGNVNREEISAFDFDSEENIYIVGYYNTSGGNAPFLPTTNKSFQPTFGGGYRDYFVAKFDKKFNLKWASYLGGEDFDQNNISIKVVNNIAYVVFSTADTVFAQKSTLKRKPQKIDLCILKFDSAGIIKNSTYLGGEQDDHITDFEINDGLLFIVGTSNSRNGIGTTPSYCPTFPGTSTTTKGYPFIIKIDTSLKTVYGSYLGKNATFGTAVKPTIAIGHDNAYYIGFSAGTDKHFNADWATPNAHQSNLNGSWDGVLSKFNKQNNLEWSTFIGGNSEDFILDIYYKKIDSSVCVFGKTMSKYSLIDSMRFPTKKTNSTDGFICEFSIWGKRKYCRYLGGSGIDEVNSHIQHQKINSIGKDLVVVVNTGDWNGKQPSDNQGNNMSFISNKLKGGNDDILYIVNSSGTIKKSGYLGGENNDLSCGVTYKDGILHLLGHTKSNYDISTKNSSQDFNGGDIDLYYQKISIPLESRIYSVDSQNQCFQSHKFKILHYLDIDRSEINIKDSFSDKTVKIDSFDYTIKFQKPGSYLIYHFIKYKYQTTYKLIDSISLTAYNKPDLDISFSDYKFNIKKDTFNLGDSIFISSKYLSKPGERFRYFSYSINGQQNCSSGLSSIINPLDMICSTSGRLTGWNKVELFLEGNGCDGFKIDSFYIKQKNMSTLEFMKKYCIFPNPTNDNITMNFGLSLKDIPSEIKIYDHIGRLLDYQLISDIANFSYPIKANLGEGLFIVNVLNGGQVILNQKILVK